MAIRPGSSGQVGKLAATMTRAIRRRPAALRMSIFPALHRRSPSAASTARSAAYTAPARVPRRLIRRARSHVRATGKKSVAQPGRPQNTRKGTVDEHRSSTPSPPSGKKPMLHSHVSPCKLALWLQGTRASHCLRSAVGTVPWPQGSATPPAHMLSAGQGLGVIRAR